MARCSHCEDDRLARCSYADCPFEVEEAQRTNETFQTRITELEAEVERLRKKNEYLEDRNEECERWRMHWKTKAFEALSRTGAVKVDRQRLNAEISKWATDSDLHITIGDVEALHEAILSALEPAAPEGRQEAVAWQHIPGCGTDRESKMVSVSEGVFCDPCIAPLVAALNAAGFATVASCCGHGHRPSVIALRDGRELFIAKDFNEARQIDAIFPIDINGNTRPAEQAVTEAMVEAAISIMFHKHGWFPPRQVVKDALKAAMEAGRHD